MSERSGTGPGHCDASLVHVCKGPGACLSPEGRRHCLADVEPLPRDGNKAKHIDVWPVIHH